MSKNIKYLLEFSFLLFVIYYLCYHIFIGEYNITSYKRINSKLINKKIEYNNSLEENLKIQNKINRLKTENLDLDLFEEELKKNTSFVLENEVVILLNDDNKIE